MKSFHPKKMTEIWTKDALFYETKLKLKHLEDKRWAEWRSDFTMKRSARLDEQAMHFLKSSIICFLAGSKILELFKDGTLPKDIWKAKTN